jgi:DNA-binding response OmpR family regulator
MDHCSILVVDDDPLILQTVTEILVDEGYGVEQAHSALEAMRAVARVHPALVLLDIRMPGLDGTQFARELRTHDTTIKIVVMTAASQAKHWAEEIGASDYIEKPFELDELLATVSRVCGSTS